MSEREYTLAIAMCRLDLLRGRYLEARKRRHGQRAAWIDLRGHVCWMMRQGL